MQSISANLNIMIKAAEKASRALIRDFGEIEKLRVSIKGPTDFVSNADLKAEKIIIEELKKARPYYSIISEEDGSETNKDKEHTWIIDPIDGTTNFLHGVPHFAISIALKSGDEIVSGLIYDPIKDEMFYAEKESGAFFNNQRIRVSKKKELNSCLFATGGVSKNEVDSILLINKNKTLTFIDCDTYEKKYNYISSIIDTCIISFRNKGMPTTITDICLPWVHINNKNGKNCGSIHVRL